MQLVARPTNPDFNFLSLQTGLYANIFGYLKNTDLSICKRVCKSWKILIESHSTQMLYFTPKKKEKVELYNKTMLEVKQSLAQKSPSYALRKQSKLFPVDTVANKQNEEKDERVMETVYVTFMQFNKKRQLLYIGNNQGTMLIYNPTKNKKVATCSLYDSPVKFVKPFADEKNKTDKIFAFQEPNRFMVLGSTVKIEKFIFINGLEPDIRPPAEQTTETILETKQIISLKGNKIYLLVFDRHKKLLFKSDSKAKQVSSARKKKVSNDSNLESVSSDGKEEASNDSKAKVVSSDGKEEASNDSNLESVSSDGKEKVSNDSNVETVLNDSNKETVSNSNTEAVSNNSKKQERPKAESQFKVPVWSVKCWNIETMVEVPIMKEIQQQINAITGEITKVKLKLIEKQNFLFISISNLGQMIINQYDLAKGSFIKSYGLEKTRYVMKSDYTLSNRYLYLVSQIDIDSKNQKNQTRHIDIKMGFKTVKANCIVYDILNGQKMTKFRIKENFGVTCFTAQGPYFYYSTNNNDIVALNFGAKTNKVIAKIKNYLWN